MLFPFITGKGFTFRILIEILFALWAILAISFPEYRPKWNLITKTILAFLAVVLVADLASVYPYKSLWSNYERMEGFVTIIHLVAYYIVLSSMFRTAAMWKWFLNTWLAGSVIVAVYGFMQLAGKIAINQGSVRLDATFGNASYLAIYTVFMIFVALILCFREKNTILRYTYAIVALLNAIVLYYTATRGSILGALGGIILTALLVLWKGGKTNTSTESNLPAQEKGSISARKIALGIVISVVVLVGVFVGIRNTAFVKSSPVLSRFASFSLSDPENQGRSYVWPMAIKGVEQRPFLGWGQESFNYVFNANYNAAMYNQEQWFDRTHDIFLDWLINAGILGLISYVSLFVGLLYILWKKSTAFSVEEKSLLTGLIAGYVFNNIFVFDNLISYLLFFAVLAWVSSLAVEEEVKPGRIFSSETIYYFYVPIITILCVVCVYYVNVPAILQSRALIHGISNQPAGVDTNFAYLQKAVSYNAFGTPEVLEQLVSISTQVISGSSADATKMNFYQLTDEQIQAQIKKTPNDARYLLLGGSFYNQIGKYDAALPLLTDAVKNSPNKPAMYFELASTYLGKGDTTNAFDNFSKGYNLEPVSPDSQIVYAIGALYAGKTDIVQKMFAIIGQNTVVSDNRILQAYVNLKQYSSAETILLLRLQKDPTNYNTELQLASIYASAGDKAKAIQLIQDVETKNPSSKAQLDPYIKQLQS